MREVYRILDANFNRAREAMRVVEDFARFVLDDAALSGLAKDLRSRLQQAYEAFPPGLLIAGRDTPGDVGTALTSPTETVRQTPADVATAACKRITEALRALEEYSKVVVTQPPPAVRFVVAQPPSAVHPGPMWHPGAPGPSAVRLSPEGAAEDSRGCSAAEPPESRQDQTSPGRATGSPLGDVSPPPRTAEGGCATRSTPLSHVPALLESIRYSAYELERRLVWRLAVGTRFQDVRLYVLLTSALCRSDPIETARAVIAGGADCIQLREKNMPGRQLLALAKRLRELTAQAGVLFIINDRPDIAALCGADGVHLGQEDLSVSEARRFLPPGTLVGVSTHTIAQARAAVGDGADYIGAGPMFPTATKDAGPLAGPDYLRQVASEIKLPHVAIGGITQANVAQLVAAGARAVAVCAAVISNPDPAAAAKAIKAQLAPPVGRAT